MKTKKLLISLLLIITIYFLYNNFFGIDHTNPDCYGNRKMFKKVLKLDSVPISVTNIRCYTDHIGIDIAEEISFECDSITANKIINNFQLKKQEYTPNFGRIIYKSLKKEIDTLVGLTDYKLKQHSPYHSFWYNSTNKHAYFLLFTL